MEKAPDIWENDPGATSVGRLSREEEGGEVEKPPMPKNPGQPAGQAEQFSTGTESLVKTAEDAEKIAAIKAQAAAEKAQQEEDEKKKAGIYQKIKGLFN